LITRRSIDNYTPLAEYQRESVRACADYCIMAAGNGRRKNVRLPSEIESEDETMRDAEIPNGINSGSDTAEKMRALQKKDQSSKSEENEILEPPKEPCLTSTGYYVVIGNEIVRPIANGGTVKVFNEVDQGDCAKFCSSNQGPDKELLVCSSLNYFPLTRKCELYSIVAEPHGPGNLVENQDVIYAEKFCLPESRQTCQEDEVFILHVQRSLTTVPMSQTPSQSISKCLKACLDNNSCKTGVFDSTKELCLLYKEAVSKSQDSIVDTPPGFVMIENGCAESKRKTSKKREKVEILPSPVKEEASSEWSECHFRVNGVRGGRSVAVWPPRMQPYTACLQISRLKILICGDKRVGKTSLIHAFRDDYFTENVQETDDMVCKMHYIQDRRTLFQMVELHIGRLLPPDAANAQAILLLFDDESPWALKRLKEYWYSKINLYFSHVPLFLVRTKCDLRKSFDPELGEKLKSSLHAMRYLECSAKQMQVLVNVRECITNPAAFPEVKQTIDSYLPYRIFGTTPAVAANPDQNQPPTPTHNACNDSTATPKQLDSTQPNDERSPREDMPTAREPLLGKPKSSNINEDDC
uniref:Apple domain-containing protein n=1 Tax=Haemonchus placei TaxID=6290 RepID=A0A0N4WUQ0_HAEPC